MARLLIAALIGILGLCIVSLAKSRYYEVVNAREAERSSWLEKVTITPDCKNPQSEEKNMECQNKLDEAFQKYLFQQNVNKPN